MHARWIYLAVLFLVLTGVFWWVGQTGTESVEISAKQGSPVLESEKQTPLAQPESLALFAGSEETDIQWTRTSPAAKRVRRVFPDPALMNPDPILKKGDKISLALFDDAMFDAEIKNVTRFKNGAVGMTAYIEGEAPQGIIYLSYCDQQLRVSVERFGKGDYYVRYDVGNGAHLAIEVDKENTVILGCGNETMLSQVPKKQSRVSHLKSQASNLTSASVSEPPPVEDSSGLTSAPAGAVTVNLMIVYTPAALSYEGNVANMNTLISQAMLKAHLSHENSNTQVYLDLVHSVEINYIESTDPDNPAGEDLVRLATSGDGHMDDVYIWRDTYEVDLTCLFEYTDATGGLGYNIFVQSGRPEEGFCLVRSQQVDYTYTMVHELGHNMGCSHSKTQAVQAWDSSDMFPYSAGWQWSDTMANNGSYINALGYSSVMTYVNFDGVGGASYGDYEYVAVPHFSNPDVTYIGDSTNSTGDAQDGDCARTLRNLRYAVAGYNGPRFVISEFPYYESFESGSVGKWVGHDNQLDWKTYNGWDQWLDLSLAGSGTDTAADGSNFLFADAYSGQTADLEGIFDFSVLNDVEFSFQYYMDTTRSSKMGSLSVDVSSNAWASSLNILDKSGDQGPGWKTEVVDLSAYDGMSDVRIRFRQVVGSDYQYSYICLDEFSLTGTVNPDVDGDGIPNEWEQLYFGGMTNANPVATAANGINTIMETYIAGLDPTDPVALFDVTLASGYVVQWDAASGRVYSVKGSTNLPDGFLPYETNILWPQSSWTDTVNRTKNFYKVDVQLSE